MNFTDKVYSQHTSIRLNPAPVTSFKYSYVYQDVEDVALFRLVNPFKQQWALYNDSQELVMKVCVTFNVKAHTGSNLNNHDDNNKNNNNNNNNNNDNNKVRKMYHKDDKTRFTTTLSIRPLSPARLIICQDQDINNTSREWDQTEHYHMTSYGKDANGKYYNTSNKQSFTETSTESNYFCSQGNNLRFDNLPVTPHPEQSLYTVHNRNWEICCNASEGKKLTHSAVMLCVCVNPHETIPFIEYDNPIDVEGAVMRINVTLSECVVDTPVFIGGWRKSDNARITKPNPTVMVTYTNVYRCFPKHKNELLYRLVDKQSNIWAFYNDTVDYKIIVKMELDTESCNVIALDHTLIRNDDSQLFDEESTPEQSLITLFTLPNEVKQETISVTDFSLTFTSCVNNDNNINNYNICEKECKHLEWKDDEQVEVIPEEAHEKACIPDNVPLAKEFTSSQSFTPSVKRAINTLTKESTLELTIMPLTTERFLQGNPVNYVINFTAEPLTNECAQYERMPFVNGTPDQAIIEYDQLYSCFKGKQEGMLFRLVDTLNRCWGFYNDTTQYCFTIECTFPSLSLADVCEPGPETRVQVTSITELETTHASEEKEEEERQQEIEEWQQMHRTLSIYTHNTTTTTEVNNSNDSNHDSEKVRATSGQCARVQRENSKRSSNIIKWKIDEPHVDCKSTAHSSHLRCHTNNKLQKVDKVHEQSAEISCVPSAVIFTLLVPPCGTRLFLSGGLPQEYTLRVVGKLANNSNSSNETNICIEYTTNQMKNVKFQESESEEHLTANCEEKRASHLNKVNCHTQKSNTKELKINKHENNTRDDYPPNCYYSEYNINHNTERRISSSYKFNLHGPQKSFCNFHCIVPCFRSEENEHAFRLIDNVSSEFGEFGFYNDMTSFDLIVIAKFENKRDIFGNDLGPPIIPINKKEVKLIKIVESGDDDTFTNQCLCNDKYSAKEQQKLHRKRAHERLEKSEFVINEISASEYADNNNDAEPFHFISESFSAPVLPSFNDKEKHSDWQPVFTPHFKQFTLTNCKTLKNVTSSSEEFSPQPTEVCEIEIPNKEYKHAKSIETTLPNMASAKAYNSERQIKNISRKYSLPVANNTDDLKKVNELSMLEINYCNKRSGDNSEKEQTLKTNNSQHVHRREPDWMRLTKDKHSWTVATTIVKTGETKPFVRLKHMLSEEEYSLRYHLQTRFVAKITVKHPNALHKTLQELNFCYNEVICGVGKKDELDSMLYRLIYNYTINDFCNQNYRRFERINKLYNASESMLYSGINSKCCVKTQEEHATNPMYDCVINKDDEWKLQASHVDWALYNDSTDMCFIVSVKFDKESEIQPLDSIHVHCVSAITTENKYESMKKAIRKDAHFESFISDSYKKDIDESLEYSESTNYHCQYPGRRRSSSSSCNSTNINEEERIYFTTVLPLQTILFITGYLVGSYRITIRADAAPENDLVHFINSSPILEYGNEKWVLEPMTRGTWTLTRANSKVEATSVNENKLPFLTSTSKTLPQCACNSNSSMLRIYRIYTEHMIGLLFRIVDDVRRCWWFYNDSEHFTFKVQVMFYANSTFQVVGNATVTSLQNELYSSNNSMTNNQYNLHLFEMNANQQNKVKKLNNKKIIYEGKSTNDIVEVLVSPLSTELFIINADVVRFQLTANIIRG